MGKIFRTNVFTGEKEWADFEGGVEVIESGWTSEKEYSTAWTTEHLSVAAAVHSSQVNDFNEDYKRHGISAYHKKDGTLACADRNSLNRVLQIRNLRNNDAGYGDWAGK